MDQLHRHTAFDAQVDVLEHLAHAQLDGYNRLGLVGNLVKRLVGIGPQADGPDHAGLDALGLQQLHGLPGQARHRAKSHEYDFRVLQALALYPFQILLHSGVLFVQVLHVGLQYLGLKPQALDHTALALLTAGDGPGLGRGDLLAGEGVLLIGQHHGLHHLAHQAVRQHHNGVAILVCDARGLVENVHGLLDARRGKHRDAVVAVAASAGNLVIVGLAGLDRTDARAATGNVQ